MNRCLCALSLLVLPVIHPTGMSTAYAQHPSSDHGVSYQAETAAALETQRTHAGDTWEGSAQGVAYSAFNHRFVGLFVLLMGFSELAHALRFPFPLWARLVLPGALGVVGVFLLVWSDHEAWPIGSLSFSQTFGGQDREILEHKFYGVLASTAALSETIRRTGWSTHPLWTAPLVIYGITGGILLFFHSHGAHPAGEQIEYHHALLGVLGVSAAASRFVAVWMTNLSSRSARRWELVWVGHIFLIGAQLFLFFG